MVSDTGAAVMYYGLLVGASGFVVGLLLENATLKRVFTTILGLTLLHAIFTLLFAKDRETVLVS